MTAPADGSTVCADSLLAELDRAFHQTFAVIDISAGVLERVSKDWPRVDVFRWLPLCEQVARGGRPEIIEDQAPMALLAVPLPNDPMGPRRVAVTTLLTDPIRNAEEALPAARVFGVDPQQLAVWATGRRVWPPHAALPIAEALVALDHSRREGAQAKEKLSEVSGQLIATFEELNLLHRMSENVSLGQSERDLCKQSVAWLAAVTPAVCVAAHLFGEVFDGGEGLTLLHGESPLDAGELPRFFERLGDEAERRTLVLNRKQTNSPTWCYPSVREVVCAPLRANGRVVGWIAALNHTTGRATESESGFGTVEASLLSSVAVILGAHTDNRRLFREQTELFDSTVRAMSSAIDAKDPYTCGHSDRVARIAVRIAKQLGCSEEELNTIYLAGLLHDVGKIGINDQVLSKPGKLTDEEYEHIKTHPELGERILRGMPRMEAVLPIVRHHHEAWDGSGYPDGLAGESCPQLARVVAVADAFDAMQSDRPYRSGMPLERVESILREGAGRQWDATIVQAYFDAREEIQAISQLEREPLDLDVANWANVEPRRNL